MAINIRRDDPFFAREVPNGTIVGVVGESGCGAEALLEVARAQSAGGDGEWLVMNQPFSGQDALATEKGIAELHAARRRGASVLLYSHDEGLIERLCDEVWWVQEGGLAHRGAPGETLDRYRHDVAAKLQAGASRAALAPVFRRGDGRAELVSIETVDETGQVCAAWASGQTVGIRIRVRFAATVDDPVVGILIRTRVGLDVYGTNTQLEGLRLGQVQVGSVRDVTFRFVCALCPQEYTITAASHDSDGVWHDWMEDAVAVNVTDTRYTAGVVNLRATVDVKAS